ncbi:MAG: hypothetical protein WBC22_10300 [Sedimentisphaerales bacterium]
MSRTVSTKVRDTLHEIRDSVLRGEPDGSAPIFGAGKAIGTFNVGDW